jgi:hypothetical protein
MNTLMVQDVRDVIADYAVATVADACALRAASTDWRLAVDGRVRNLVAMSQPALRPPPEGDSPAPSPRAPLILTKLGGRQDYGIRHDAVLDDVRIA